MKIRTASFRHETRLLTLDWLGHPKLSVLSNNPIRGAKKAGESLLFGLHHILPGSLSSHPLRRVHVNTMTHLLLSNHSTLCSVNVSGIRSGSLTWPFPERKILGSRSVIREEKGAFLCTQRSLCMCCFYLYQYPHLTFWICIYSVITFITSYTVPPVPSSACVMYYTWFKHVNISTFPLIFQFPPPTHVPDAHYRRLWSMSDCCDCGRWERWRHW